MSDGDGASAPRVLDVSGAAVALVVVLVALETGTIVVVFDEQPTSKTTGKAKRRVFIK